MVLPPLLLAYLLHAVAQLPVFGLRLLSLHNLWFLEEFMRRMRKAILDGTFPQFRAEFLEQYDPHRKN